jgi:aquaporin Z
VHLGDATRHRSGRRSGAHLNPALTLAFWITGHVHPHDVAGYWVAQFVGALAGAGLVRLMWGEVARSVGFGVTHLSDHHGEVAEMTPAASQERPTRDG